MKRLACIVVCAAASSGVARAGDYDDAPRPPRVVLGLELGETLSPSDGPRRDLAPIGGLAARYRHVLSERTALSVGTSLPFPPFLMAQVIALYEWGPRPASSGLVLRGGLRPAIGLVDLCGVTGDCPLDEAAEPGDRAGWFIGVAGEVGAGWRFQLGERVSLEVIASYLGGVFDGRQRETETAISGYYQGGMLSIDVLF